jgi:catechol 2,3-dioxygenase-like lactoylglutathione lyase family enzyme
MIEVLGVDNLLHAVDDLQQARDFYGGFLGLSAKFESAGSGMILYRLGSEEPGLVIARQDLVAPRTWLEVTDAREAARYLGAPAREITTGWVVETHDPWGNVLGFTDYVNAPQLARKR